MSKADNKKKINETNQKKNKKRRDEKKKIKRISEIIKSEKFLGTVFVLLLILVVILGVMVAITPKVKRNSIHANILLPLIKTGESFDLSVNAKNLSKIGKYIFKVINYKDGKVISEEIPYKITIENNIGAELVLNEDDSDDNLITDSQKSIIERKALGTSEEKAIYYTLKIKNKKKYKDNELIQIRVET